MSTDLPWNTEQSSLHAARRDRRLRPVLAGQIDLLLREMERPRLTRGPQTLVPARRRPRRRARSLVVIAAMLRDSRHHVTPEAMEAVRSFLHDGADSPLYGRDPATAALATATAEMELSHPRRPAAATDACRSRSDPPSARPPSGWPRDDDVSRPRRPAPVWA